MFEKNILSADEQKKSCLIGFLQDLRTSNMYGLDENSSNSGMGGKNGRSGSHVEVIIDEEVPLIHASKGLLSRSKPS